MVYLKDFGKQLAIYNPKFDEIYKRTRFHGSFDGILTNAQLGRSISFAILSLSHQGLQRLQGS